jgi:hypothetical protein
MYLGLHVTYAIFLTDFNLELEFSGEIFEKKLQYQIL